jgi:hypothetical protein
VKKPSLGRSCAVHCSPDVGEANHQVEYETGESMTWEKP